MNSANCPYKVGLTVFSIFAASMARDAVGPPCAGEWADRKHSTKVRENCQWLVCILTVLITSYGLQLWLRRFAAKSFLTAAWYQTMIGGKRLNLSCGACFRALRMW